MVNSSKYLCISIMSSIVVCISAPFLVYLIARARNMLCCYSCIVCVYKGEQKRWSQLVLSNDISRLIVSSRTLNAPIPFNNFDHRLKLRRRFLGSGFGA